MAKEASEAPGRVHSSVVQGRRLAAGAERLEFMVKSVDPDETVTVGVEWSIAEAISKPEKLLSDINEPLTDPSPYRPDSIDPLA